MGHPRHRALAVSTSAGNSAKNRLGSSIHGVWKARCAPGPSAPFRPNPAGREADAGAGPAGRVTGRARGEQVLGIGGWGMCGWMAGGGVILEKDP
jgi:hypothetical protein